jgi:hypothetical protein
MGAQSESGIFNWPVDGGGNVAPKLEEISCGVRIVPRGTIFGTGLILATRSEFVLTFQMECSTWNIGRGGGWEWIGWPLFHVEQFSVNCDIFH